MDHYPKSHLKTALVMALGFAILALMFPADQEASVTAYPVSLSIDAADLAPLAQDPVREDAEPSATPAVPESRWHTVEVRRGDSLSSLFDAAGLTAAELHEIMQLGKSVAALKRIIPGKKLAFEIDDRGQFQSLRYEDSALRSLLVTRIAEGYQARWNEIQPEVLVSFATATITDKAPSLYHAGKQAGLSDNIIMKLSNVFQWDISFALDLREGDSFSLMYEDVYIDGEKVKEGDIVAAQFDNMGKRYVAVQYQDENGRKNYFTPEGASMRKAFLRDPVHFSHVSSSFNLKRFHPIHKRVMPHRGIDYAASKGTPVLAAGDGKVTIARQNSSSGRYVVLQHGQQYTTKYLHLSGFARGIKAGTSVKQGDVIGYVGATGWATAPHLHYEFLLNGIHRNPRTVALPQAQPIASAQLERFRTSTAPLLTKLSAVSGNTSFAMDAGGVQHGG